MVNSLWVSFDAEAVGLVVMGSGSAANTLALISSGKLRASINISERRIDVIFDKKR